MIANAWLLLFVVFRTEDQNDIISFLLLVPNPLYVCIIWYPNRERLKSAKPLYEPWNDQSTPMDVRGRHYKVVTSTFWKHGVNINVFYKIPIGVPY